MGRIFLFKMSDDHLKIEYVQEGPDSVSPIRHMCGLCYQSVILFHPFSVTERFQVMTVLQAENEVTKPLPIIR